MKTGYQTALKVISIITIILGALAVLSGIIMMVAGSLAGTVMNDPTMAAEVAANADLAASGYTTSDVAVMVSAGGLLIGVIGLIAGIIYIIVGILGVRGANDPTKIGPFRVFAIIGLVLAIISFVAVLFNPAQYSQLGTCIPSLIITIVLVWLSTKIKSQASAMQMREPY